MQLEGSQHISPIAISASSEEIPLQQYLCSSSEGQLSKTVADEGRLIWGEKNPGSLPSHQYSHRQRRQQTATDDAMTDELCFRLWDHRLYNLRPHLQKEVLRFASSQNSPVSQHSQCISVLLEAGAPQEFPTRVTG